MFRPKRKRRLNGGLAPEVRREWRVTAGVAARDLAADLGLSVVVQRGIRAWVFYPAGDWAAVNARIRKLVLQAYPKWSIGRMRGLPVWCPEQTRLQHPNGRVVDLLPEVGSVQAAPRDPLAPVPVPFEPTRWWVPSASHPGDDYLVDSDYEGGWVCTCDGFMLGGRECRHIKRVKQLKPVAG